MAIARRRVARYELMMRLRCCCFFPPHGGTPPSVRWSPSHWSLVTRRSSLDTHKYHAVVNILFIRNTPAEVLIFIIISSVCFCILYLKSRPQWWNSRGLSESPGLRFLPRDCIYVPIHALYTSVDMNPHQDDTGEWAGDFDPFADPEERRVLFSTFDSFRCVLLCVFQGSIDIL